MKEGIYWCNNCNVPLLSTYCDKCKTEGKYCASDLKPVFSKERETYEKFLSMKLPDNLFRNRNRIIFGGSTLFRYKIDFHQLRLSPLECHEVIKSRIKSFTPESKDNYFKKMKRSNIKVLKAKEKSALKFIRETSERYRDLLQVVSFAGGKDSSVVAILVKKALGDVPLFFSDTTLEYPETYKFIKDFAEKYNFGLIKDENGEFYKSPHNFFELCEKLGPPSIRYRWCCTVLKAYPVNEFYKIIKGHVLAFDGTRKNESHTRRNYKSISLVKKISRQVAAYPILVWREADVWSYLLFNNIDYNPMYELGHTRVGCFPCPNAGPSNCFFRKFTHPALWSKFEKVLEKYANRYDKDRNWIINNYWRLRLPKKDKVNVVTSQKDCKDKQRFSYLTNFTYRFDKPIDKKMVEFLKPIGEIEFSSPSFEVLIGDSQEYPSRINGIIGRKYIRVSLNPEKLIDTKEKIEKQITKALNCIGCGGCIGSCPFGAISIQNDHFTIDSDKCTHCKKCIHSVCIALNFKIERKAIKASQQASKLFYFDIDIRKYGSK